MYLQMKLADALITKRDIQIINWIYKRDMKQLKLFLRENIVKMINQLVKHYLKRLK